MRDTLSINPSPGAVTHQRRVRLEERFSVDPLPAGTHVLDLWYPLLGDDADQQVLDVSMDFSAGLEVPLDVGHDLEYGNPLAHLRLPRPAGRALEFEISYLIRRADRLQPAPGVGDGRQATRLMARELEADAPTAELEELRRAAGAVDGAGGPLARARRLVDAAGVRGPRGVERFVELCRLAGIPTRLVAGLHVLGGGVEEHLWAELFIADRGWVAADPRCSLERCGPELVGPGLDHLSRSRGQRLLLQPVQRGPRLPFLSGPYAEVDGRPLAPRCVRRARVEGAGRAPLAGARVPDLGTLLAEELVLLTPAPARLRLRAGATLPPGAGDQWLYVITAGRLRLSRLTPGGRSLELAQLAAPAFLQADRARRGLVEAMEDSEVRCLTREQVLQVARRRPEFGFRLLETFGERLVESEDRLEYLAYHRVAARLALALLRRRGPDGAVEGMTHQRLGDIVGASRETVTKVLGQFQAEGCIRVLPRRIEVLAAEELAGRLEDR